MTVEFFAPDRVRVTAAAFELKSLGVEPRPVAPSPSARRCSFESADALDLATQPIPAAGSSSAGTGSRIH
ncbi:hypothetical protein [Amycolatopsis sp. SID8362]|uniref:hypothetical protein n=1 Tax=Amycolatopsis sp. SID8362 TaxID=2690346 RepID=UPI0013711ADE|nr:hypothetical protein [Amycolatopsis sp. SID8362]NBH08911.1 hypothetical protein [Amycolatopsis sp. SID8362]NED45603.1 hypothetical protein [Amycolatopsis sp. SID8362]